MKTKGTNFFDSPKVSRITIEFLICLKSVSHPRNSHLRGNFFKITFLVKKGITGMRV